VVVASFLILLAALFALSAYSFYWARRAASLRSQAAEAAASAQRANELEARLAERNAQMEQLNRQLSADRSQVNMLRARLAAAERSATHGGEDLRQRVDELNRQLADTSAQATELAGRLYTKTVEADALSAELKKEKVLTAGLTEALGRRPEQPEAPKPPQETSWGVLALLAAAGAAALYLGVCALLLYTRPLWILRLHERLAPEKVFDAAEWGGGAKLAKLLVTAVGVDYFAKHERTRQAWRTQYRLGGRRLGDLPKPIRTEYIKYDDILDVWVDLHRQRAAEALDRIDFLKQRKLFVRLPIEVRPGGRLITHPVPNEFSYLFDPEEEMVVEVVGRGGSGKSTFAGQLARWALDPNPAGRPARHLMIPVFIPGEVSNEIVADVAAKLRRMFGPSDDLDEDLLRALLARKRVLVIIDGVSERSAATQEAVRDIFGKEYVGALVITSRVEQDFGPKPVTFLTPRYIAESDLDVFITDYFSKTGVHVDLSLSQMEEVKRAVAATFKNGAALPTVTPLIVTLIADHAVELWKSRTPLSELSASSADAIVAYLRRVNPQDEGTPNCVSDEVMIRAARILAKCCLGETYTPKDFDRVEAEARLREAGCDGRPSDVIARLIANDVLEPVAHAGTSFLSFDLDPVAEYLAAMYVLNDLRDNRPGWEAWIEELRRTPGYPAGMQGFLGALEDCVDSHRGHFGVPDDIVFPWLEPPPEAAAAEYARRVNA
jgi:hypothetical protein